MVSRRVVRRHDRSDESSDRRITGCDRQSSRRIFRTSFPRGALLGRRSPRNRSGRTSPFRLLDLARRSMLARIKLTTWSRKLVEHPPASSPHPRFDPFKTLPRSATLVRAWQVHRLRSCCRRPYRVRIGLSKVPSRIGITPCEARSNIQAERV